MSEVGKRKLEEGVSVIIPAYNAEKWIKECVTSVYANRYGDIEIIVVDDGSTDNTVEILCELGFIPPELYPNSENYVLKMVKAKHGGDAHARNEGIKIAQGKYLMFVDADDKITWDRIHKLRDVLEKDEDIQFVTTNWLDIDTAGNVTGKGYMPPLEKYKLFVRCLILFGGSMYRREGFGLFEEEFPVYSDWAKMCEYLDRGRYVVLEEPYYLRRRHGDKSLSQEYLQKRQDDILKYRRVIWKRYKKNIPEEVYKELDTGD